MTDETTAEIFSPPYLFKGPRPVVAGAPAALEYGGTATFTTPDAERVAKVTLVRMGAVTHNVNMDQRYQELPFRRDGSRLVVGAPASGNVAPPGVYYVFLVDAGGVPSKAAIVRIASAAPAGAPPASQPVVPAAPAAPARPGRPSLSARRLAGGRVRLTVAGRAGTGGCAGAVRVAVRRGTHTLARARLLLAADCRYARRFVLRADRVGNAHRLRVRVRLPGAGRARTYRVRIAPRGV